MSKIVDRLKIIQYRLKDCAIPSSIKQELASIIEELEK